MAEKYAGLTMTNATSLILFGVAYFIFFGVFLELTPYGAFVFSWSEIAYVIMATAVVGVAAGAIAAGLLSWKVLGSGPEAGPYAWKAALFTIVALLAGYFVLKLTTLMPPGTPWEIVAIFIAPPLAGMLWGMFAAFLKSGLEG